MIALIFDCMRSPLPLTSDEVLKMLKMVEAVPIGVATQRTEWQAVLSV
jgi:hypothetical protein